MSGPRRKAAVKQPGVLDLLDVDGLGALVAHLLLVGDLRALGEAPIAVADDARVVDEQVPAALIGRDEAESLVVAEPLHGSGGHAADPPYFFSPPGLARPDGRQPTRN